MQDVGRRSRPPPSAALRDSFTSTILFAYSVYPLIVFPLPSLALRPRGIDIAAIYQVWEVSFLCFAHPQRAATGPSFSFQPQRIPSSLQSRSANWQLAFTRRDASSHKHASRTTSTASGFQQCSQGIRGGQQEISNRGYHPPSKRAKLPSREVSLSPNESMDRSARQCLAVSFPTSLNND